MTASPIIIGSVSVSAADARRRSRAAGAVAPRAFAAARALAREEMTAAPVRWPRPSRLQESLAVPAGRMADALGALGVRTVGELLEHLPVDSRQSRTVAALSRGEQATVAVRVRSIRSRPVRRRGMRPLVEATVADATGSM